MEKHSAALELPGRKKNTTATSMRGLRDRQYSNGFGRERTKEERAQTDKEKRRQIQASSRWPRTR
ncbi:MAG: hypothetical protein NZ602_03465 [Thermoguttaceae bacterium]|nr:hypothetical protein [Thermoguttaceae bacterium]